MQKTKTRKRDKTLARFYFRARHMLDIMHQLRVAETLLN